MQAKQATEANAGTKGLHLITISLKIEQVNLIGQIVMNTNQALSFSYVWEKV